MRVKIIPRLRSNCPETAWIVAHRLLRHNHPATRLPVRCKIGAFKQRKEYFRFNVNEFSQPVNKSPMLNVQLKDLAGIVLYSRTPPPETISSKLSPFLVRFDISHQHSILQAKHTSRVLCMKRMKNLAFLTLAARIASNDQKAGIYRCPKVFLGVNDIQRC